MSKPDWGIMPDVARRTLQKREWDNRNRLRKRLLGEIGFPIQLPLKPPTASQASSNIAHLEEFLAAWRAFPWPECIVWTERAYRALGQIAVPKAVKISTLKTLTDILGSGPQTDRRRWDAFIEPLIQQFGRAIYPALISNLQSVDTLQEGDSQLLAKALMQLQPGMGDGLYLRALPLSAVDTKFIEDNEQLITDCLDAMQGGTISDQGGLRAWLGCVDSPSGWLTVRPLCEAVRSRMGGFPLLKLHQEYLREHALPAERLLVVENLASGLGLPELTGGAAVIAGGKNVAWMSGHWLKDVPVGYWGDLDTWGLDILSLARAACSHIEPLMMDRETLDTFSWAMVAERRSCEVEPENLYYQEMKLFQYLLNQPKDKCRLEQERISQDYAREHIEQWINNH